MNKNVYGVVGIKAVKSNWNADFDNMPRTLSNGEFFATDNSIKFTMKKLWQMSGEKVFLIKSFKKEKEKMIPLSLKERYERVFNSPVSKKTDSSEVMQNLMQMDDIRNFGITFAEEGNNIGLRGCVQIGIASNKYDETQIETINILSPFRNPTEKKNADNETSERGQTTIGTKNFTDEAHFCYPFSIYPNNMDDVLNEFPEIQKYNEEDYHKFQYAALFCATAYNSCSKSGCENEYAIFVEMKENEKTLLSDLAQYIKFQKDEDKNILILDELVEYLNKYSDKIEKVDIFMNTSCFEKLVIDNDLYNVYDFSEFSL